MSSNFNCIITSKSPKYFNGLFIKEIKVVPIIEKNIVEHPFKNLEESSNNEITLLLDIFVTMYQIRDTENDQYLFNQLFIELFELYPETIIALLEDDSTFPNDSSKYMNNIRDIFLKEVMSKDSFFYERKR